MRKARRKGDRLIEFAVSEVFVFIKQTFPFSRLVNCATARLNEGKKLSGEAPSPGFRPWFVEVLPKISRAGQGKNFQFAIFDLRLRALTLAPAPGYVCNP